MSSFKEFSSKSSFVPGKAQERVWVGKVVDDGDDGDGQGNIEIQLVIIITTIIKPTIQASYNLFKPVKVRLSWYGCQSDEIE